MSVLSKGQVLTKIPVIYFGGYFLPIEKVKRKLREEFGLRFTHIQRFDELSRALKANPLAFVIFYHDLADPSTELKQLKEMLAPHLKSQQSCFLVIAARNSHKLSLDFRQHRNAIVLPNTILPAELFTAITNLLKQVTNATPSKNSNNVGLKSGRAEKQKGHRDKAHQNNYGFNQVDNPSLISELFIDSIHAKSHISLFDESLSLNVRAVAKKYNQLTSELQLSVQGSNAMETLKSFQSPTVLVNLNLRRSRTFFKVTQYRIVDDSTLIMTLTEPIFEVQRRSHIRLTLKDEPSISFNLSHPEIILKARIFDLSAGGVGILIDAEIARHLKQKTQLNNVEFMAGHRKVVVSLATVCYVGEEPVNQSGKSYIKVGVQFDGVRPLDRSFISMYVYRESLKTFG